MPGPELKILHAEFGRRVSVRGTARPKALPEVGTTCLLRDREGPRGWCPGRKEIAGRMWLGWFTQGLTGWGRVRTRERCDRSDQSGRPECRFRTCTDAGGGVGGVCIRHLETVPVPCIPHLGCSDSVVRDTGLGHLPSREGDSGQ